MIKKALEFPALFYCSMNAESQVFLENQNNQKKLPYKAVDSIYIHHGSRESHQRTVEAVEHPAVAGYDVPEVLDAHPALKRGRDKVTEL